MKHFSRNILSTILLSTGVLLAIPALAQTPPERLLQNGAAYITGGVGEDEALAFQSVRGQYNLHLIVTSKTGGFLADIPIKIVDGKNQVVLDATTDGPYLFAKLPAGRYQIIAGNAGAQKRTVQLGAHGGTNVHFTF